MPLELLTRLFGILGPGRSPATVLNLFAPRWGYRLHKGIAYGSGERHTYDVYAPPVLKDPAPVIVFFYGGGFVAGHRKEYRMVGACLARMGFVVAVPDYRIFPQVRFPEFLHDGGQAFAAVRRGISQYGGNPERMFLAGHSAGAYIAVMLTVNAEYLKREGGNPAWISGCIGLAGAYDFLPITNARRLQIFGGGDRLETQPIHFADGKKPPMLLAAGANDNAVSVRNTRHMAARLRAMGSEVEEIIYPRPGHMGIILSLAPGFGRLAPLRGDIARFVAGH